MFNVPRIIVFFFCKNHVHCQLTIVLNTLHFSAQHKISLYHKKRGELKIMNSFSTCLFGFRIGLALGNMHRRMKLLLTTKTQHSTEHRLGKYGARIIADIIGWQNRNHEAFICSGCQVRHGNKRIDSNRLLHSKVKEHYYHFGSISRR